MVIYEDFFEEDVDVSPVEEIPQVSYITLPSDPPEVEPLILINSLISFVAHQTLKLNDYSKHNKVIILVVS
jgi:hypothetical protein